MEDLSELLNSATGDQRRRKSFYEIDTEFEKMRKNASIAEGRCEMWILKHVPCLPMRACVRVCVRCVRACVYKEPAFIALQEMRSGLFTLD